MPLFTDKKFILKTPFQPEGDQPQAIEQLVEGIESNRKAQVLLGVTGSGKTFTMANVIAKVNKPTLVLCHNKTLAAQLFTEFRDFFPDNAVEYFVSYYDYYQPEAYIPSTDTFIEKDSQINDEIDKLRHSATRSLLERNDVIIVSSVSCIYGLGSPEAYEGLMLYLEVGREAKRQDILRKLVEIQYKRNDIDFFRGVFRVRGDVAEVFPAYEEERAIRIEFFGDEIEALSEIDPLRGVVIQKISRFTLYPASHYVTTLENRRRAIEAIRIELRERLEELKSLEKLVEAQRLAQRTLYDLEMLEELGYCQGIENYSPPDGAGPSEAPPTLLEYFPKDWMIMVDESHVTIPQIGGMFRGDRARKLTLVEHGFRLPSALDNRPLNFQEWEKIVQQAVYVSATPGAYELGLTHGEFVEQVIRPTGLVDPKIEVRPATAQVDNLMGEIAKVVARGERVLVTTLTKKFAEDLTRYYREKGVRVKYLHSEIDTLQRIEIIRDLRLGLFDVLVGINLLREGLDLPEVSLVAIFDADKEGFLRSSRSLIQTIGRAARNVNGTVILYADKMTDSMKVAIGETDRRRTKQEAYNLEHGITPTTVVREIAELVTPEAEAGFEGQAQRGRFQRGTPQCLLKNFCALAKDLEPLRMCGCAAENLDYLDPEARLVELKEAAGEFANEASDWRRTMNAMGEAMRKAAKALEFEKAGDLRDRLRKVKQLSLL